MVFGRGLELLEDNGGNLFRGVGGFADDDRRAARIVLTYRERVELALFLKLALHPADEPLDRGNGAAGLRRALPAGDLAGDDIPVLKEGHHRGGLRLPLGIGDDHGGLALDNGNH
jgi:hypothetical protein